MPLALMNKREKFPARTVTFATDSVVADPTLTILIMGDILE